MSNPTLITQGNKQGEPGLGTYLPGVVALTGQVFGYQYVAGAYYPFVSVPNLYLHRADYSEDCDPSRGVVPRV